MVLCFLNLTIGFFILDGYLIKLENRNRLTGVLGLHYDKYYVHKNQRQVIIYFRTNS